MNVDLLPGQDNVVRFPVERRARPTLDLMREIAPDSREVSLWAEGFGLEEPPHDLRRRVDARTAKYIADQVPPEPGEARRAALEALLAPLVEEAVRACRDAHDAALANAEAQRRRLEAATAGRPWAEHLRGRADEAARRAAELLIEAHARCEEAEGAARAVDFARRGEPWRPHDPREVGEWLIAAGKRG